MKFKKGESGNPKGRPRGARNKTRSDVVDMIARIVENNLATFQNDLDSLEPRERVRAITSLMGYVVPKLQATTSDELIAAEYEHLSALMEQAPDEVIDEIYKRFSKIKEYNEQTA